MPKTATASRQQYILNIGCGPAFHVASKWHAKTDNQGRRMHAMSWLATLFDRFTVDRHVITEDSPAHEEETIIATVFLRQQDMWRLGALAKAVKQDCIMVWDVAARGGHLLGPHAHAYAPFDSEYFFFGGNV